MLCISSRCFNTKTAISQKCIFHLQPFCTEVAICMRNSTNNMCIYLNIQVPNRCQNQHACEDFPSHENRQDVNYPNEEVMGRCS